MMKDYIHYAIQKYLDEKNGQIHRMNSNNFREALEQIIDFSYATSDEITKEYLANIARDALNHSFVLEEV